MIVPLVWLLILSPEAMADDPAARRWEFQETHMGSAFRLVFYCKDETKAETAARATFDRIAELDAILSDYDSLSELSRLGQRSGGPPVPVSDDLFRVLERSRAFYEQSDGAFDITIGPVVKLWRRARRRGELPPREQIDEALQRVGSDKLELDPEARAARLNRPRMQLDPGGIAKGYACDEALAVLRRQGIQRALIAGAGDIRVGDPPPGQGGWTVGIAPLQDPERPPTIQLQLANAAVSTSGDAERFVEIDGQRYSHIVDPKTGVGLVGRSSVTVVAPDGTTADALATAVSVLGPERGLELIEATEEVEALIVEATEPGTQTITSSRFAELPRAEPTCPSS